MKCPHCLMSFHPDFSELDLVTSQRTFLIDRDPIILKEWTFRMKYTQCPACERAIVFLLFVDMGKDPPRIIKEIQVWPKGISRSPLPKEVPAHLAEDYREACLVLADSPKASAALSRRSLQNLLREKAGVKPTDLSKEIDEILASKTLPSDLADAIDGIRHIGNFAAHPLKSTNTGLIVDVEPGEAEWTLDVQEDLFDFYFVRPTRLAGKRDALNKKLAEVGKPPMKQSKP